MTANPLGIVGAVVGGLIGIIGLLLAGSLIDQPSWGFSDGLVIHRAVDIVMIISVLAIVLGGGLLGAIGRSRKAGFAAAVCAATPVSVLWWSPKLLSGLHGDLEMLLPISFIEPSYRESWPFEMSTTSIWLVFIGSVIFIGLVHGLIALLISGRGIGLLLGPAFAALAGVVGLLTALIDDEGFGLSWLALGFVRLPARWVLMGASSGPGAGWSVRAQVGLLLLLVPALVAVLATMVRWNLRRGAMTPPGARGAVMPYPTGPGTAVPPAGSFGAPPTGSHGAPSPDPRGASSWTPPTSQPPAQTGGTIKGRMGGSRPDG